MANREFPRFRQIESLMWREPSVKRQTPRRPGFREDADSSPAGANADEYGTERQIDIPRTKLSGTAALPGQPEDVLSSPRRQIHHSLMRSAVVRVLEVLLIIAIGAAVLVTLFLDFRHCYGIGVGELPARPKHRVEHHG